MDQKEVRKSWYVEADLATDRPAQAARSSLQHNLARFGMRFVGQRGRQRRGWWRRCRRLSSINRAKHVDKQEGFMIGFVSKLGIGD